MTIAVNADCTQITLTPADPSYITNIQTGVSSTCCTYLEIGTNCCDTTNLCLRSNYSLDYSVSQCGTEVINSVTYNYFDITLTGIDVACVQELEYTSFINSVNTVETNPSDLTVRLYYTTQTSLAFEILIKTCTDSCLEYKVEGLLTISDIGDPCNNYSDSGPAVTIPTLPTGVSISGTDLIIIPSAFGYSTTAFPAGVYTFSLVQNNVPDGDSVFVNCDVLCKVTDYIADDLCSNLYALYNALVYADSCDTITYEQKCSLWEYIGKELDYFETSPCGETSDCGCNS